MIDMTETPAHKCISIDDHVVYHLRCRRCGAVVVLTHEALIELRQGGSVSFHSMLEYLNSLIPCCLYPDYFWAQASWFYIKSL